MNLTEHERGMGLLIVTCNCCGNVYKDHKLSNACAYSNTPNFGCHECQGVLPKSKQIQLQNGESR